MRFFAKRNLGLPVLIGGATLLALQTIAFMGQDQKKATILAKIYEGVRDFSVGFSLSFFTSLLSNYCCPPRSYQAAGAPAVSSTATVNGDSQRPYASLPPSPFNRDAYAPPAI